MFSLDFKMKLAIVSQFYKNFIIITVKSILPTYPI